MQVTQFANIFASFLEYDRLSDTTAKKCEDFSLVSSVVLLFNATCVSTYEKVTKK